MLDELVDIIGFELCWIVGWIVVFVVVEMICCVVLLFGLCFYIEMFDLFGVVLILN